MKNVEERRSNAGTSYIVSGPCGERVICISCVTPLVEGQEVAVFYDQDFKVLMNPSIFMHQEMFWDQPNSRLQAISALKVLLSFAEILDCPPEHFDKTTCKSFLRFLRGALGKGTNYSFCNLSTRSESTINAYLKVIRKYMKFRGAIDSPFLATRGNGGLSSLSKEHRDRLDISAMVPSSLEAPKYVTIPEYKGLLSVLPPSDSAPDALLVRLMFEHGLRLGECLGLTYEDLRKEMGSDGAYRYSVILRDRVSDKPFQRAKSVIVKPKTREEYLTSSYATRDVGWQRVYISDDLYFAIDGYIESVHGSMDAGFLRRSQADSVGGKGSLEDNHYVFLNSLGSPLSSNLWNKRLRSYFLQSGLHVDEGSRKTNLSHRLRHGYAMALTRSLGLDDFTVRTLMRHKSFRSTEVYQRPTEEDIHEMYAATISGLQDKLIRRS